jgi:hypothetical protein
MLVLSSLLQFDKKKEKKLSLLQCMDVTTISSHQCSLQEALNLLLQAPSKMEQLQRFPIEDTPKQKKKKKMRTLSRPTGPNELFTILAMAWQATTGILASNPGTQKIKSLKISHSSANKNKKSQNVS